MEWQLHVLKSQCVETKVIHHKQKSDNATA